MVKLSPFAGNAIFEEDFQKFYDNTWGKLCEAHKIDDFNMIWNTTNDGISLYAQHKDDYCRISDIIVAYIIFKILI